MSYQCDICSTIMPSKEAGFSLDRNRVLVSPSYWDHVFRDAEASDEDAMGNTVGVLLHSDTGYIACAGCSDMLQRDSETAKEYRLDPWFARAQLQHFKGDARELLQAILITIGTVFESKSGKWPDFIGQGEFEARGKGWDTLSERKIDFSKEKVLQLIRTKQSDLSSQGEQALYQELNKIGNRVEILDILRQLESELDPTLDNMLTISVIQTVQNRY